MLIPQRQSRLQDLLSRRGMANLETLAGELNVSQSTIRRDIDAMVQRGLVTRTHGGVIWVGDRISSGTRPYAFDQRMGYQLDAKRQIARAAAGLIQPGETVLIDGGTTTFYLAQELLGIPLQIVTNSLPIANLFLNDENVELVLTGGIAYPRYGVLLGPILENVLATIHVKRMFFSVAGIHDGSLYNQNMLLVQAEKTMMRQTQQVVLLADSSKFGQQALARLCDLGDIHTVVSDSNLESIHQEQTRAAGCQLLLADPAASTATAVRG
ncbi:MAG: DeoR/GlpR transcriptional regulator [Phycisphaerales bacterium]|nr:DeoR/GlpR transcriptional regulator [Phycisphaerales bacterium]